MRALFLVIALFASAPALAAERTVTLLIDNMTCSACPYIVRESIGAVPGVRKVDVSYETRQAIVTFDDAVTGVEALTAASTNAGYPARPDSSLRLISLRKAFSSSSDRSSSLPCSACWVCSCSWLCSCS